MVQNVGFIGNGSAGPFELTNGPDDLGVFEVARRFVIEADREDARVPALRGPDELVEILEIIMISC